MTKQIEFYKMVASGNDFLVLDNRKKVIHNPKHFGAEVCRQHTGVGADGLLLIEPSHKFDFFLRIINSDGSEAEACGNGYRCVGLFAHEILGFPKKMTFETLAGKIEVEVGLHSVKALMAEPSDYEADVAISLNGHLLRMDFVNTGVPHVVIFSEGLDAIPVATLGRAIRYHQRFQPKGTNVNFVEVTGRRDLQIRTYERGVEDETLACGTGSVAAAICSVASGRVSSPVTVYTKGGEALKVCFDLVNKKPANVYLEGSAEFICQGKLLMKDLEK